MSVLVENLKYAKSGNVFGIKKHLKNVLLWDKYIERENLIKETRLE